MSLLDFLAPFTVEIVAAAGIVIVAGAVIHARRRPAAVDTRTLALTAGLAAVYTLFRIIPISRLIGTSGAITAGGVIIPVIAVLLEPEYGILSVFTGTMIASFAPWNPLKFAGLDFVPGAMNVVVASLVLRGRRIQAAIVLLGMILLFTITPNTRVFVGDLVSPPLPYFWLHLVALGSLLLPVSKISFGRLQSGDYRQIANIVGITSFVGTMTEHISGGVLTGFFFGLGAVKIWPLAFVVYPFERAIIVAGAIMVCTPFILKSRAIAENLSGRIWVRRRDNPIVN